MQIVVPSLQRQEQFCDIYRLLTEELAEQLITKCTEQLSGLIWRSDEDEEEEIEVQSESQGIRM
jgi:hypothetical protein